MSFADRMTEGIARLSASCAVGLDPRVGSLPRFAYDPPVPPGWDRDAAAVLAWGGAVIEATAPVVPIIKPQSAFYERLGADGYRVLEQTIRTAQAAGLLVLLDAKRGDIGSTAQAYAETCLSHGRLGADAMTVNHYFGQDGIEPFLAYVSEGKGLFVVVHSSNPSAARTQDLALEGGTPYYERVGELVAEWGRDYIGQCGYSSVGAVVGATFPEQLRSLRAQHPAVPFLIPGYGQQGGRAEDVTGGFGASPGGALVAASRSIYSLSDEQVGISRADFVANVAARATSMARAISAAVAARGRAAPTV